MGAWRRAHGLVFLLALTSSTPGLSSEGGLGAGADAPCDVCAFLSSLGLEKLVSLFAKEEIDSMETLVLLGDEEFELMGVRVGPRVQIKKALKRLSEDAAAVEAAAAEAAAPQGKKLPSRRRFYDDDADDDDDDATGRWRTESAPPDDWAIRSSRWGEEEYIPSWIPIDWANNLASSAVSGAKSATTKEEEAAAAAAAAQESDDTIARRTALEYERDVEEKWMFARSIGAAHDAWKRLSPKTEVRDGVLSGDGVAAW